MERNLGSHELEIARRVQEGLLAVSNAEVVGLEIVRSCQPADSLGGDFYTFINRSAQRAAKPSKITGVYKYVNQRDDFLGIGIGDVAGHGVSSALVMALSAGILNEIGRSTLSPSKILNQMNQALNRYIFNSDVRFVTAFYGVLQLNDWTFHFAKAGHPAPVVLRATGEIVSLESDGVFLGVYENETYEEGSVQLQQGDLLVLYTDGITEARREDGAFFGEERLLELLRNWDRASLPMLSESVFDAVARFTNFQPKKDDQTLVLVRVQ